MSFLFGNVVKGMSAGARAFEVNIQYYFDKIKLLEAI